MRKELRYYLVHIVFDRGRCAFCAPRFTWLDDREYLLWLGL